MSGFCGNPNNHEAHFECDGINRVSVKEEVIVEKWEPELNKPAYPAPENMKDRSEGWMKGWYAGHDGLPALSPEASEEFCDGFNEALQWRLVRGLIKVNAARALQGLPELPEYDPVAAGEIRTTSSTGGMKGVKPERYSLIPTEALDIMARLYGFGAEKYEAHNWRKGYEWSKSFDSLFRHATSALRGEDIDPETGLPHLAGVVFHCFTLMVFAEEHPEFDDRWKPELNEA